MHMGPDFILVNISMSFVDTLTADEMEKVIDEIDRTIKAQYPPVKRIFIEAEARRRIDVAAHPAPGTATD
jgi:divalent metal cation (Fe/Co/Zn/Cd) transporter